MLIVAHSGRALAVSGHRAGYACRVVDLFADLDTLAVAEPCRAVPHCGYQFRRQSLQVAVDQVDPERRCTVVYGSGFELEPAWVDCLARDRAIAGNSAATIAAVKTPTELAVLLAGANIPHPEIQSDKPRAGDWLVKRAGGSGGVHVRRAGNAGVGEYYQRRVGGGSFSATVLSNGSEARIVGFAEQWCTPLAGCEFAYGGAVSVPANDTLPAAVRAEIAAAIRLLVRRAGLRGLWGIDFMIDDDAWWLIEINPRPGMSFELHQGDTSLVELHMQACRGKLPAREERNDGLCRGQAVVYCNGAITIPNIAWPRWSADRPAAGRILSAGEPICSVGAEGVEPGAVKLLLAERERKIRQCLTVEGQRTR